VQRRYRDQLARIDRLLEIVAAPDQLSLAGNLAFEDVVMFACQSMWHLKDWLVADKSFHALDISRFLEDVHAAHCLMICADIANGSKHAALSRPKTSASLSDDAGIHLDGRMGIYQVFYYVVSADPSDPYHGMEVRPFLRECRATWQRIIDTHYLSGVQSWIDWETRGA
jgi:hypothetical protein